MPGCLQHLGLAEDSSRTMPSKLVTTWDRRPRPTSKTLSVRRTSARSTRRRPGATRSTADAAVEEGGTT
ncbi:MAG: hypothetical protein R2712_07020 [Vicinamibacterales bacterium]